MVDNEGRAKISCPHYLSNEERKTCYQSDGCSVAHKSTRRSAQTVNGAK